jgi:hypothetical protein
MLINYQAELRDPATGQVVPDGSYDMVVRIHDSDSGGSLLWEWTYTAANGNAVEVANGIFSVIFGSGTGNALDASLFEGADRWLEIEVQGETLSPRQRITSTAFSIVSENSRLLDGRGVSDFIIQAQGLRLESNEISPNVIGGYLLNLVTDGVVGGTVSGGGESSAENRVSDSFGTVGGGRHNLAGDDAGTINDKPGATVGGGAWNTASGTCATVGGGLGNQVTANFATIAGGGRADPANPLLGNFVFDHYGSIGGGGNNRTGGDDGDPTNATYATVGGGGTNWATGQGATIGGGFVNEASGYAATVSGGDSNAASGSGATISGGESNTASHHLATVGGGALNTASAQSATVSGGDSNDASDWYATVSGGQSNDASANGATVGGGNSNDASGLWATVGGGISNEASAECATVGGGRSNEANANFATIAGGGPSDPPNPSTTSNRVTDDYGTIGGGGNNQAGDNAGTASDANFATVGGGHTNIAGAFSATVAGGAVNKANAPWAAIGGGNWNKVTDESGTVAGGNNNRAGDDAGTTQDARYATVAGGEKNTASKAWSSVVGGESNTASANHAAVGGGGSNIANGWAATIPGGAYNEAAGDFSFAAGYWASANHDGAFVWADSQHANIASTKDDEVTFRCKGGVRFTSGAGGANQMVSWAPGNSSWTFSSDRNLKENFVELDAREVLDRVSALSIAEWNFKGYSERHVGPMAQDFHALFPLGGSNTMIDSGDLQGVSLAAIQGLHEIVKEKDGRISTLEARIEALESLVGKLVESQTGGDK